MKHNRIRHRLQQRLATEWRHLATISPTDRPWQLPFAAALSSGLPLLFGAYLDHLPWGLISSLGGMVFLYLPETPLPHRMFTMMGCCTAITACYALGLASHLYPPAMMFVLAFSTILATMACRYCRIGPPGNLFFVMAAAAGAYAPGTPQDIPLKTGLLFLGALEACLIALLYSLFILRRRPARPAPPLATFDAGTLLFDPVVIGLFTGLALALAQLLKLENAYWVPVSCLAVIQGINMRAIWNKQLHRIIGTALGLVLAYAILLLPLDKWSAALLMTALAFVIESLIVRHYGLAAMFITPMTILLVDAAHLDHQVSGALVEARFIDTVLGCLTGLAGGFCLHHPELRRRVLHRLRKHSAPLQDEHA